MPDFPTRARFRAGLQRAAQRRRAEEARWFGPRRQVAGLPSSSIPPDLAQELDAIGQQIREAEAAEAPWRHQKPTHAAQAYLKLLVKG